MRALKVIISAITLLAVAVNPVAAAWMPCCCTSRGETQPIPSKQRCCDSAAKSHKTCCAQKEHGTHGPRPTVALDSHACCCVKALPVTVSRVSLIKQTADQHLAEVAWPGLDIFAAPSCSFLQNSRGHYSLSGRPLLALYCTWLK